MAIGNISDWKKINTPNAKERVPDWRRFEKPSTAERIVASEREEEGRRLAAYDEYLRLEASQPQLQGTSALSYVEWSKYLPTDITDISLASQIATNAALLSKARRDEAAEAEKEHAEARQSVIAGKRDNGFSIPASAAGLKMSHDQAKKFVREQAQQFADNNPDFFPSQTNFNNLCEFLLDQGVSIPNEECLKLAWLRLRELGGLLEERPAPAPEPTPIQEPPSEQPSPEPESDQLGWDVETGEKRLYKPYEVSRMSAEQYRQAFRVSPKFTRGYFG